MLWENTWPCLQSRDKLLDWMMVKKVPGTLGQAWTWVFMRHLPGHHGNAGSPSSAALTQSKMFWHFPFILYYYYYNFQFKKDLIHTPCVLIRGTTIHQAAGLSTGLSHHCWPLLTKALPKHRVLKQVPGWHEAAQAEGANRFQLCQQTMQPRMWWQQGLMVSALQEIYKRVHFYTSSLQKVSGSCCFCFLTSGFLKSLCRVAFVLSTDRYNLWFFIAGVGPQWINSKSHISIFPQ